MKGTNNRFREYLWSKGLKLTPQREFILREVFSTHSHFQVDDLFVKVRRNNRYISRATVYRTLDLLVEGSFLREVIYGERHSHYEHVLGHRHHDHLVCLACGKVIEFSERKIEDLQDEVCRGKNFEPHGHRLQIEGLCRDCQIKKQMV